MQQLKKVIQNTLINKLELIEDTTFITSESIETCSDYIVKDMKEAMIGFIKYIYDNYMESKMDDENFYRQEGEYIVYYSEEQLFNQFISERYKEQK